MPVILVCAPTASQRTAGRADGGRPVPATATVGRRGLPLPAVSPVDLALTEDAEGRLPIEPSRCPGIES